MVAISQQRLMTVEEFEAFCSQPENVDRLLELVEGEIVEKMPSLEHGSIVVKLSYYLFAYVQQHDIKGFVATEASHRPPEGKHNVRLPDLSFTSKARVPEVVKKGSVPQMPDLAVEVKSPDDSYLKLRDKADFYLKNGVRMVWLIYPEKQIVEVYQPDSDIQLLTAEDTLEGGAVLPGFQLKVKDIFDI